VPDQIPVRSVRTNGLDFIEVPTADEAYIAALRNEARSYRARGWMAKAEAVDAEIRRLTGEPEQTEPTGRRSRK